MCFYNIAVWKAYRASAIKKLSLLQRFYNWVCLPLTHYCNA